MAIEFITTRELKNNNGEYKGRIRILKKKDELKAMVDYTCPECDNSFKDEKKWEEPFVTGKGVKKKFNIICPECGHEMTVLKLKKQIKKEKKAAKRKSKKKKAK